MTSAHPFWSVTRDDFIPVGELHQFEEVVTIDGQIWRLTSTTSRAGPESVYNFEVAGEHVYYVIKQGLLVHNVYLGKVIKSWSGKIKNSVSNGYRKIRKADRLNGDHRLPQDAINTAMDAANASNSQRRRIKAIMDSKKNLRPMEDALNKSKGNRNMRDWRKTLLGGKTSVAYRNGIHRTQRSVANDINKISQEGRLGRPRDWFKNFFG